MGNIQTSLYDNYVFFCKIEIRVNPRSQASTCSASVRILLYVHYRLQKGQLKEWLIKVADAIKVQFNRWRRRNRLPSVLKYGSEIWNVWIWLQAAGGRDIFWALIIEERAETQPAVLMEGPDDCTTLREQTHRGGERGAASWELINVRSMAWLLFTRARIRDNVTIRINPVSYQKYPPHLFTCRWEFTEFQCKSHLPVI